MMHVGTFVTSRTCYTIQGYEIIKTALVLVKMAGLRHKPVAEFLGMKVLRLWF
jgi:hypothetical protein